MSAPASSPPDFCYPPGLISVEQARAFILERARPISQSEKIGLDSALGRVLAVDERAASDVPGYANSAMDGYAVRGEDVSGEGMTELRVAQRVVAGGQASPLAPGEAARIFTGAPVPEGADTVIVQEVCETVGEDRVRLPGPPNIGEYVRPRGNDMRAGDVVLERGTRLRPQELGLAASVGLAELEVVRRPRVAIFSSGDELVEPGQDLRPGQIYNSNRYTLMAMLKALGCEAIDIGMVEDTLEATRDALAAAGEAADVVVSTGGMSVGEEDHVKRALEDVGHLEMWQVAVKPGKPLAYGRVRDADFLGLPGNPVSTLVTFCLFVRPFLLARLGVVNVAPRSIPVRADFDWRRPANRREFVRARLRYDEDGPKATIFPRQGSDVMSSTVWADGLVEVMEATTVAPGDWVNYHAFGELLG